MTFQSGMFPPNPPTVAGGAITMEQWLANPARVQRTITALTNERFVADRIFAQGPPATGGAVIYDQVLGSDLYTGRDVQAIEPGSEFPIVDLGDVEPMVARTVKWGGAAIVTYEMVRRNQRDELQRRVVRLRNTIVRKVDTVAIAVLLAAPINELVVSDYWTDPTTDIFADVATGKTIVDRLDLGYEVDSALISPNTALAMLKNRDLRASLPREETRSPNPVRVGKLSGVAGIEDWYATNRISDDDAVLLQGKTAGSISDELPTYSRVVNQEEKERYLVMAARLTVPYVTDPKSATRLRGIKP